MHQIIKSSGRLPVMGALLVVVARLHSEDLTSEPVIQYVYYIDLLCYD